MNCATCKVNKIGLRTTPPYGGFLCNNEHLQCMDCNALSKGQCGICQDATNFVQIKYNPSLCNLQEEQTKYALSAIGQPPSAPPLPSQYNSLSVGQQSSCALPRKLFDEIEMQTNFSQEHLKPRDSKEMLQQYNANSDGISRLTKENETNGKFVNETIKSNEKFTIISANKKTLKEISDPMTVEHTCKNEPEDETALGIRTSIIEEMKEKPDPPELTNDIEQQEILSTKVLQKFEAYNNANSTEVKGNYLRTYGPLANYNFPCYNCQQAYCNFGWHQQQTQPMQNMVEYKNTTCVSTDCDPYLKNHDVENLTDIEVTLPAKLKPKNYLVMHTMGVSKPEMDKQLREKFGKPSLDMRMQKILETFQEDPKTQKLKEIPLEMKTKACYIKIPTATTTTKPPQSCKGNDIIPIGTQQIQTTNVTPPSVNNDSFVKQLLNSHRAYYNPPNHLEKPVSNLHTLAKPVPVSQEPPCSQFQTIPCISTELQELMIKKSRFLNKKPVPANRLTIPRTPIKCPESTCQRMTFLSDFNKHLAVDHYHLPMEHITPFQCKNFFLDPRLAHCGISKCHILYLMRHKITDLGNGKYKNFLPLLIMSSRISLMQMCGLKEDSQQTSNQHLNFLIIWVTGIVPEEFPISVTLTVWARSGKIPSCHVVYSGDLYSIRQSQLGLDVWQSGRMLLLSSQKLDLLTNGGKEMLNLQLMVH